MVSVKFESVYESRQKAAAYVKKEMYTLGSVCTYLSQISCISTKLTNAPF